MSSYSNKFRWMSVILISTALFGAACKGPTAAPTGDVSKPPSNYYLTLYATTFVDALRADGTKAGAFEMSRRPAQDGCHHLHVELWGSEEPQQLDLALRGEDSGLTLVHALIDNKKVFPGDTDIAAQFAACHQQANRVSRGETEPASSTSRTLDVDFRSGGDPGTVRRRFVRLEDFRILDQAFEDNDLLLARDGVIRISSLLHRNLMRLGVGSEAAFQRLAQTIDWGLDAASHQQNLAERVRKAGLETDKDCNPGYWSPLDAVAVPAGTVFAVRAREASNPAALLFIQEVDSDRVQVRVICSPLGFGSRK
ncbi:MAG: hypothetical protein ACJAYX_004273 [Planctomycetota bacterium]|jgi:hypothetical protein